MSFVVFLIQWLTAFLTLPTSVLTIFFLLPTSVLTIFFLLPAFALKFISFFLTILFASFQATRCYIQH